MDLGFPETLREAVRVPVRGGVLGPAGWGPAAGSAPRQHHVGHVLGFRSVTCALRL